MVSVTKRIKAIKQPYGGYLPIKDFNHIQLKIEDELHSEESISPGLIGTAVDYLTRFILGDPVEEAFRISLIGARILKKEELIKATSLLDNIKGLDNPSIISACKLVGYDTVLRAGPMTYQPVELIAPDKATIENIQMMVNRCIDFIENYGPVVLSGFSLDPSSITNLITSGDGDFVTEDTLWDFKVTKNRPTKNHTLQLLIYYLMCKRSITLEEYFEPLKYLGIYNPRLQSVYRLAISDIAPEIINIVEKEVIGY